MKKTQTRLSDFLGGKPKSQSCAAGSNNFKNMLMPNVKRNWSFHGDEGAPNWTKSGKTSRDRSNGWQSDSSFHKSAEPTTPPVDEEVESMLIEELRSKNVSLSERQHQVLVQIMRRHSVFFTGAAGSSLVCMCMCHNL